MPPFSMAERYGKGIAKIGTALPSLGLFYVAAELEKAGYAVKLFDTQIDDWNPEILEKPDAVGIYCNTSNYHRAVEFATEVKERFNVPIIFGGPHVTIRPLEVLNNEPVDYVVVGEGEVSVVELMDVLNGKLPGKRLNDVKGIGFKENGKAVINPARELIKNLDSIAFPARHLVDMAKYQPSPNQYKRLPVATMIASRGCPYNCAFCNSTAIWTRMYRIRSVENVIQEIKQLVRDYGVKTISFWDDILGINKEWLNEFCDRLLEEKIDIIWSCSFRVDNADRQILKKMKQAGCWCIFYGVETIDQEILKAINKRVTVEQITNALKLTKEAGIEIKANLILGLPGETPERVKKILKILCKLNPDYVKFNVLTPYPETVLYNEIKDGKWGKIMNESYDKLTGYFATFLPFGYKDLAELEKTKKYAYRKFYFRLGYIMPKLLSIRSFEDLKRFIRGALAILAI